ncbi:bifunctional [glutamine synthetase] adenylyltransferase/[glutamine synthetase]-adenylyl-L-tyrosine phosphorylase [Breoghania sp.]|uniref:bifunctional [glutamine synthetase] adenylyltransferase/[glutamine synthetase]-adenylyl-L-tyrosine phosphorylase n=1 Tax=Breoghania sp. TaxID=2065378 RepID=UPI00261CDBDA|nr:bifunctional [glutamine synthetase] adenylyltransferase/[glutamine synthetase]-adenylyl-L-tyrosine phosphorylase [Breoghania sp.]MDJ0931861.1 bifunctional [glutamine synthetase] adenylyltransferase/[glutamine synthetase]-adenylyl-L-tyrosine phosphorylase [Breoghania sp.]
MESAIHAVLGNGSLAARIDIVPQIHEGGPNGEVINDLIERAGEEAERLQALLDEDDALKPFLSGVFANAPYLRDLAMAEPSRLARILESDPADFVLALLECVRTLRPDSQAALEHDLRCAKAEAALAVALADLSGAWPLEPVTASLSALADAALDATIRFLLTELSERGKFKPVDPEDPAKDSGWIVLAMGKHGAEELNYSSDIDLIVLYDPHVAPLAEGVEAPVEFVRLTKRLVKIMQERTANGYVFRTDLRLRPDPGATPLAMSVPAALIYYESMGQNWERAALIKARPCAGDKEAGRIFLHDIAPFIWRKHLDFAAIADVHSIKRQINAHKGHAAIAVSGHNVKLGRGGIREIEFFVQTQQLIAGGRNPRLRNRRTLEMLKRLCAEGWVDDEARAELDDAYRFLRAVEHRIQMVNDEQTQTLPEIDEGLMRIAALMGFSSPEPFGDALRIRLHVVQKHYADLFEAESELASELGNLVFTGDDDDPDTLETLSRIGFKRPLDAIRIVKSWHFGRYPATRSAKARERLTELHPALIDAFGCTTGADAALSSFDRFLSKLPAGVPLFSLLYANPHLLSLLATIMGEAPRMSEIVSRRASVLDAILDPSFYEDMPREADFAARLETTLALVRSYEDALDRARIFGQEQMFLIGVRLLSDTLNPGQAGRAYTRLARVLVRALLVRAADHLAEASGRVPGGEVAVLAMGKLGGFEMTPTSDLDMILLYDYPDDAASSDGQRPLSPSQYYMRLTQRLVAAISAPTAEGTLYEVDFRLRPSGNAGPLATRLSAFSVYQSESAWTWEHMALTRADVIAGDEALRDKVKEVIREVLCRPRDLENLRLDVADMRARIEAEKGSSDIWSLKTVAGGIIDIEFIAQYLQLANAAEHPEILTQMTEQALGRAAEFGLLSAGDADILAPAIRLYHTLTQILRLSVGEGFDPEAAPAGVRDLLARSVHLTDFARLEDQVRETQGAVRATFERIIGPIILRETIEK